MKRTRNTRIPLSPVDTAWLRMEDPTNLMMITGVFLFDQPLDFETIKLVIERKMLRFRRFRQRVIQPRLSFLPRYWIDDPSFDIDAHLHRIALPAPGDQSTLEELVNDFMSMPLDYSKPLWQFHLVENFGEGCALLCRLHHCIADGIALMRVLLSLTDDQPDEWHEEDSWIATSSAIHDKDNIPLKVGRTHMPRNSRHKWLQKSLRMLTDPPRTAEAMKLGIDSSIALAHLLLLSPDPVTPYKGKLGVMKRCSWSQPIALKDVKAVGRVTRGTINDVVLAAVSGALGRYLRTRGEPTGGLDFRAVIPVNLRPPEEPLNLGNAFGLVFLSLPVGIDDPLDRLLELKNRMDSIKGTPEAIVAFGILNAIGVAPAEIEDVVVNLFGTKATTVITNVPGPKEIRYFAGQPIKGLMFWVPQSGRLGLGVSILSYAGEVLVGMATDAGLVPDPESLVEAFHTEFDDLMDLVRMAREADAEVEGSLVSDGQCQGQTRSGRRCKNRTSGENRYCRIHDPQLKDEPALID
ncbi:MAG TPA: wax ester/triacylglycerol synthase family O-acyltransferase [Chloroflexi bacterium]|nr:wax ester/triacylglycerol synthase family O-acyltransferase [Chloroflexota bacterium]